MKGKATQKKPEYDYFGELARYINGYLKANGLRPRRVIFLTDAPYPLLPKHYAVRVEVFKLSGWWFEYCAWAEPEGYVDLFGSVETWLQKITEGQRA